MEMGRTLNPRWGAATTRSSLARRVTASRTTLTLTPCSSAISLIGRRDDGSRRPNRMSDRSVTARGPGTTGRSRCQPPCWSSARVLAGARFGSLATTKVSARPTARPTTAEAAVLTSHASTPPTAPASCDRVLEVVDDVVGPVPAELVRRPRAGCGRRPRASRRCRSSTATAAGPASPRRVSRPTRCALADGRCVERQADVVHLHDGRHERRRRRP